MGMQHPYMVEGGPFSFTTISKVNIIAKINGMQKIGLGGSG
jgi:hypothetical protein